MKPSIKHMFSRLIPILVALDLATVEQLAGAMVFIEQQMHHGAGLRVRCKLVPIIRDMRNRLYYKVLDRLFIEVRQVA